MKDLIKYGGNFDAHSLLKKIDELNNDLDSLLGTWYGWEVNVYNK